MAGKPVQTTFSTFSASVEIELDQNFMVYSGLSQSTNLYGMCLIYLCYFQFLFKQFSFFGITAG